MVVSLRPSREDELELFNAMDSQEHAREFVLQTGIQTHLKYFRDPNITYLSIEDDESNFCGYFILVFTSEIASVEFRRILIDQNKRGIGQLAIAEMEKYCEQVLKAKRIWLDVFEDNEIGMHIYEKLGYRRFKSEQLEGRALFFYEKYL